MHGDEPVDFDIVVGCGVRVTSYSNDSPSYDAFRDPLFFVKATRDGGAVLQIVPNACRGETTANREVPKDFLPGAIWFDKAGDFNLGTAYISEDAFENPSAKLTFLGATVQASGRKEWEAFRPIAAQNLLSPMWFSHIPPLPPEAEVRTNLWNKEKLFAWSPNFRCYGVLRYHLSEPNAREILRQYWPDSRPRFWMPAIADNQVIRARLSSMNHGRGPIVDGHYYQEFSHYQEIRGFPTRAGGGDLVDRRIASKVFPFRADDGLPWLTPALGSAAVIYRDVDLKQGANAGYAYCYLWFRNLSPVIVEPHLPNYFKRTFAARVDGELVHIAQSPGITAPDIPYPFFESDEYSYSRLEFGLD